MSSSSSLPSVSSPLATVQKSPSPKTHQPTNYLSRRTYIERLRATKKSGSVLSRSLAHLKKSRAKAIMYMEEEDEKNVPDLNISQEGVHLNVYHDIAGRANVGNMFPQPKKGFAFLAVTPPPSKDHNEKRFVPSVVPYETPNPNYDNLQPLCSVTVKSMSELDLGVMYYIRGDETLRRVYHDYANKCERKVHEITLYKRGKAVEMTDTPISLELISGDTLLVQAQNPAFNLDTRVKHFYVRDHYTFPTVVKVSGELHAPLQGLYELWAEYVKVNPDKLNITHEGTIATSSHTVVDAEIYNEDDVYVLCLS